MKNYEEFADSLYQTGYRPEDRSEIIKQYGLSESDAEKICQILDELRNEEADEFPVSFESMMEYVDAGIVTFEGLLKEVSSIKEIECPKAVAHKIREEIEKCHFEGTTECNGVEYKLLEDAYACGAGSDAGRFTARVVRLDKDGGYRAYWNVTNENAEWADEACDWDHADEVVEN